MTILEEAFKKENYLEISFSFNSVGHPTIPFTINDKTVIFLLDTGAAGNFLDIEFAKELGIPLISTGEKGGGAGGLIDDIHITGSVTLFFENIEFSFDEFYAMNFDSIRLALTARGVQEDFQGILGFDFFKQNSCFIDYSENRIFVKPKKIE
jgi:hypothetical protein